LVITLVGVMDLHGVLDRTPILFGAAADLADIADQAVGIGAK
jgi:hypothetical protein